MCKGLCNISNQPKVCRHPSVAGGCPPHLKGGQAKVEQVAKFANLHRSEIQNPTCSDVKSKSQKHFLSLIVPGVR